MKWQIYLPHTVPSSDQEWQLHISTDYKSYCQMKWQIYWLDLLFHLVLPSSDQEWQLPISTVISHIGR